jgi:hypothetical protein
MLRPLINREFLFQFHSLSNSANKYAYTTAQNRGRIVQIRLVE